MRKLYLLLAIFYSIMGYAQESSLEPFEKRKKYGLKRPDGTIVYDAILDAKPTLCRGGYWIISKGCTLKVEPFFRPPCGEYAILNAEGKILVDFQPNKITEYITSSFFYIRKRPPLGLFIIQTPDHKFGIIDTSGRQILPPVCDAFRLDGGREAFAKYGFISYAVNGKYGVIKLNGEEVLKPEFDCMGYFKESGNENIKAVAVRKDGKCGLFFNNGNLLPPAYDEVWSNGSKKNFNYKSFEKLVSTNQLNCNFYNDMTVGEFIVAVNGNKKQYMTNDLIELDSTIVLNAKSVENYHVMIVKDENWGVYSLLQNQIIIPCSYQFITTRHSKNCVSFIVKEKNKYFIIDENNKKYHSEGFDGIYKKELNYSYNFDWGLCKGDCDSVYYINDDCSLESIKVAKWDPVRDNPFAGELDKISKDIDNKLQQLNQKKCVCCNGTGKDKNTAKTYIKCFKCEGKGYVSWTQRDWSSAYGNQYSTKFAKCDRCGGSGQDVDKETPLPCRCCNGKGYR